MADDNDSFENRLKALADQLARSLSDTDVDEVAERFGVDPDRVRGVTGAVERWLNDRGSGAEPLFGDRGGNWQAETPRGAGNDPSSVHEPTRGPDPEPRGAGPHPLDLATETQGRALSALDSGRWTVRPGSSELALHGPGPAPAGGVASDLVNELRARDWITADGTVTLVGRQALLRWTRIAEDD
jgi:hypothetical protein